MEGQHAHVLVPPDQLSLAIGREGQNVRLAARLTGWKIDVKNSHEYDQEAEDEAVSELIIQREDEENLQREAELKLEAEQAERAAEDARLRELYPLPEDDQEYEEQQLEGDSYSDNDQFETEQNNAISANEERKRWYKKILLCEDVFHVEKHMTGKILKITKDHKQGIMFQKGMGRSAYICNSKECYSDPKIKKASKCFKNIFRSWIYWYFWKRNCPLLMTIPIREYN